MATHSSILAWKTLDREAGRATVHGNHKESDMTKVTQHSTVVLIILPFQRRKIFSSTFLGSVLGDYELNDKCQINRRTGMFLY